MSCDFNERCVDVTNFFIDSDILCKFIQLLIQIKNLIEILSCFILV